jgi:hypothetical protein
LDLPAGLGHPRSGRGRVRTGALLACRLAAECAAFGLAQGLPQNFPAAANAKDEQCVGRALQSPVRRNQEIVFIGFLRIEKIRKFGARASCSYGK